MKAKLAKTRVSDSVITGVAASGPSTKNFTMQGRHEVTQRKDLIGQNRKPPQVKRAQNPTSTPSTYKGKGDEMSDEDSEDDIAAANERMKAAAAKFAVNANNNMNSAGVKKKKTRAASRGFEERKTTVRNMSKNIYKPSFNLPAKEPKSQAIKADKPKSNARDAAKAYAEE